MRQPEREKMLVGELESACRSGHPGRACRDGAMAGSTTSSPGRASARCLARAAWPMWVTARKSRPARPSWRLRGSQHPARRRRVHELQLRRSTWWRPRSLGPRSARRCDLGGRRPSAEGELCAAGLDSRVRIGCTSIGGGAIILPGIVIGEDGDHRVPAVVTRNVASGITVWGNPARRWRTGVSTPSQTREGGVKSRPLAGFSTIALTIRETVLAWFRHWSFDRRCCGAGCYRAAQYLPAGILSGAGVCRVARARCWRWTLLLAFGLRWHAFAGTSLGYRYIAFGCSRAGESWKH